MCVCLQAQDNRTRFKDISKEDLALIQSVSEQGMTRSRSLSADTGPVELTEVRALKEKPGSKKGASRTAMAYFYKYAGNVGVISYVDLDNGKLLRIEERPHLAIPFSPNEIKRAIELAEKNPQVAAKIAQDPENTRLETLPAPTMDSNSPMFHHRVTRILIQRGKNYLSKPIVYVDLTDNKVYVQGTQNNQ